MRRPEFTSDENYIIKAYQGRSSQACKEILWGDAGKYVPCCLLAFLGFYNEDLLICGIGFCVLLIFSLHSTWQLMKWIPIYSSIFEKYESAFTTSEIEDS